MAIQFLDVVGLINRRADVHIEEDSVAQADTWVIYRGYYSSPGNIDRFPFYVLYLFSRPTLDNIRDAHTAAKNLNSATHVVYAESIPHLSLLRDLFGSERLWSIHTYLAKFIKLESYINHLHQLSSNTKYYYPPHITAHPGSDKLSVRNPNLLLEFIKDQPKEGKVAVALAEPGQGKTFECEHLVGVMREQYKAGTSLNIPLYINSAQWRYLSPMDLGSLEKTIINSFKAYKAELDWIDGYESQFLNITLRAGLFRIVFDGFDEYVLRNHGQIDPGEAIGMLSSLARSTQTNILITARTAFWLDIYEETDDTLNKLTIQQYEIRPFDNTQAEQYFIKRFPSDGKKAATAKQIFTLLSSRCRELVGRGFVLNLIADLVDRESESIHGGVGALSPLHWIIEALCEREEERENLPLDKTQQFVMLRTFAVDSFQESETPPEEILDYAIGIASENLPANKLNECKDKLAVHPIISRQQRQSKNRLWQFKEEQVENFFIADYLLNSYSDCSQESISGLLQSQRLVGSKINDLAAMSIELIQSRGTVIDDPLVFGVELRKLVQHLLSNARSAKHSQGGMLLALSIARHGVDRLLRPANRTDRGNFLKSILSDKSSNVLNELVFSGALAQIDFTNTVFRNCAFESVQWIKCRLDSTSVFERCQFSGGIVDDESGTGFGSSYFDKDCYFDRDADRWISNIRLKSGKRKYTKHDLSADLGYLVKKFQGRGGFGFISVESDVLGRGTISSSLHRAEIISAFISQLLETHHISGVASGGYHVIKEAREAFMFFFNNNQFVGPLASCFDYLVDKLGL